jgi:CDP-diacylglycerol pyrophosphatase
MNFERLSHAACFAISAAPALVASANGAAAFDLKNRNALWYVVNDLCRPMQETLSLPAPCLKVDVAKGYAVLRAPGDATQIIVTPTARIQGAESPALQRADAPNLWSLAWNERSRVAASAPRPLSWDDIGMAVNARRGRSQDLLHLHIDCVDPRLKQALAARAAHPTAGWPPLDLRPWARRYRVKMLGFAGLESNLFKLVADEVPGAAAKMSRQSIAVVGVEAAKGVKGFAVLVDSERGHAEELLDHGCAARK